MQKVMPVIDRTLQACIRHTTYLFCYDFENNARKIGRQQDYLYQGLLIC